MAPYARYTVKDPTPFDSPLFPSSHASYSIVHQGRAIAGGVLAPLLVIQACRVQNPVRTFNSA